MMARSLTSCCSLSEKTPGPGWERLPCPLPHAPFQSAWRLGPIFVLSSLVLAYLPSGRLLEDGSRASGLQWAVSVTTAGRRPKPKHVRKALRAFDMVGSEEDNHGPGNARLFFLVVDPAERVECECKTDETIFTDTDGYRYTLDRSASPSRCVGCFVESLHGRPCQIHNVHQPTSQEI